MLKKINKLYKHTASYNTNIPNSNGRSDETDIYYPVLSSSNTETFPIALFLQGGLVDKSDYSNYANIVASYGFVVVVPNRRRFVPNFGEVLAAEVSQINDVLQFVEKANTNPDLPINNIINTEKMVLLGHSIGGNTGLKAIVNTSLATSRSNKFTRPDALVGGAFYATNLRDSSNNFIPINNEGIPIALLGGSLDGVTLAESEQKTYNQIQDPPKALITVSGANHYGITNDDSLRDPIRPTLEQEVATETIARWSALFLRATVLDDKDAKEYVFETGAAQYPNVNVISETIPIPENTSFL
ncbi:MAG: chlorophyllase [Prochloraceae cyanobacterium]|nr:chlorophyllase [Prochloraceae cyanobacterium]